MRGARELVYDRAQAAPASGHAMAVSRLPPQLTPAASEAGLVPHWIGGRAVAGGGARLPLMNPASGRQRGEVALASLEDVRAAVAAARAALPGWAQTPAVRR